MTNPPRRGPKRPSVISPVVLADPATAPPEAAHALLTDDEDRRMVLIELRLDPGTDPDGVREDFMQLFGKALGGTVARPAPVGRSYMRCMLTPDEIQRLVRGGSKTMDTEDAQLALKLIYRVWPDLVVEAHVDRSLTTIKADAAVRTYGSVGTGIVWGVLDSGIDESHPHFANGTLTADSVKHLHKDFTIPSSSTAGIPASSSGPLKDAYGHGTHVAGIIAGQSPADPSLIRIASTQPTAEGFPEWIPRVLSPGTRLCGVAPQASLVSLKVLDDNGKTLSSVIIDALDYVREVNSYGADLQIHGVNLSLGCGWMPRDYAAGQSPLCRELNLLTATGVISVVSAGNSGAGTGAAGVGASVLGVTSDVYGQLSTITDPGNAANAITVGSVHRYRPHENGVTFDSSKGPTLDGRRKPDLVAPGERITSAATGLMAQGVEPLSGDTPGLARYIEDSGTSMAAAHVSGAIAGFLSARIEYVGQPQRVKELLLKTASDLGRHEFFQGAGLVDLMRALSNT